MISPYDEFRYASRVVWTAYSAWAQDACSDEHQRLLRFVSMNAKKLEFTDESFKTAWDETHDEMVQHYVDKLRAKMPCRRSVPPDGHG